MPRRLADHAAEVFPHRLVPEVAYGPVEGQPNADVVRALFSLPAHRRRNPEVYRREVSASIIQIDFERHFLSFWLNYVCAALQGMVCVRALEGPDPINGIQKIVDLYISVLREVSA